jgi:K+-transporting ATPase KdpF subunit
MAKSNKILINTVVILYLKILLVMNASILLVLSRPVETNLSSGYIIGAIIALFIFGYLVYSLVKPEKF